MNLISGEHLEALMLQLCRIDIVGRYHDGQPVFVPLNIYVPWDYTLPGPCVGLVFVLVVLLPCLYL
jgi:hypothetical protein